MSLISIYAQDMSRYMLAVLPAYALLRIAYLRIRRVQTTISREVLLGIGVLYVVGLLSQTVLPPGYYGFENGEFYARAIIRPERYLNLVPLRTVWSYAFGSNDHVSNWDQISSLNLLANVGLFMPIGFLLPLLRSRITRLKHVFVVGVTVSVAIEVVQFFFGRSADVDDVILNVLGVCVGYGVLTLLRLLSTRTGSVKHAVARDASSSANERAQGCE